MSDFENFKKKINLCDGKPPIKDRFWDDISLGEFNMYILATGGNLADIPTKTVEKHLTIELLEKYLSYAIEKDYIYYLPESLESKKNFDRYVKAIENECEPIYLKEELMESLEDYSKFYDQDLLRKYPFLIKHSPRELLTLDFCLDILLDSPKNTQYFIHMPKSIREEICDKYLGTEEGEKITKTLIIKKQIEKFSLENEFIDISHIKNENTKEKIKEILETANDFNNLSI